MKQSEIYGYNFPLNWDRDTRMDKIKEAVMRQVEYEVIAYEPYEMDIPMLAKSDNIKDHQVWEYVIKGVEQWVDEHIQIV